MKWIKKMKKALNKQSRTLQKSMPEAKKCTISSVLVGVLFFGSLSYKKPAQADNGGRVLGLGLTGAAIGGIAGGGRGAGIGAATGLGLGLLTSGMGSGSNGSDPYRKLDRLERKRERAIRRMEKAQARANSTSNMRKRERYMQRAQSAEADVRSYDRQIAQVKTALGMKR